MIKSSAKLIIELDKDSYFQDETLHGTINLSILKDLNPQELILKIKGKETNSSIKTIIISHQFSIFQYKDGSLSKGEYCYPFSLQIPRRFPASIHDKPLHIKIQYKLKTDLLLTDDEIDFRKIHGSKILKIKHYMPINEKPVKRIWSSKVQVCCFRGGITLFNVRLDNFFFKDGQTASIKCYIDNSKCRIPLGGIFFRFIRNIEKINKTGLVKKFSKTIFTSIHELSIEANKKDRVFAEFDLPLISDGEFTMHTTTNGSSFKNSYILKVSGYHDYYCFASTLSEEEFPIIIYEEREDERMVSEKNSKEKENIVRADIINLVWKEAKFYLGKNLDKYVYPEFEKIGFDMSNNKLLNPHGLPDSTKNEWEIIM